MGQFNSLSGKDETEKKNMAYKYHAVSALQLIRKLLLEMTLQKRRAKHFTITLCNGLEIFSSYLITPHHLIITGHTGEKVCAGDPGELTERKSMLSQGAGAGHCLAATRWKICRLQVCFQPYFAMWEQTLHPHWLRAAKLYPKWAERWQCPANQPALPTLLYLGLIQQDQNTELSWAFEVLLLKLATLLPISFSVKKGWEPDKHGTVSWTSPVRTGINIYSAWRKHIWWWVHLTLVLISRGWSMFLRSIRKLHKSIRRKEKTLSPTGFGGGLLFSGHGIFLSLEHGHKHVQFSRSGKLSLSDT